jgi:hypothetical protein
MDSKARNETIDAKIFDPKIKVELYSDGPEAPTSMSFLGHNDILVLEKNHGTVRS